MPNEVLLTFSDVEVYVPFPAEISRRTHKTYLDSIGRTVITLKKSMCTESHAQTVYVSAQSGWR